MDAQLKGGSKGQSDEEMETDLDKALMLFRYISVSPLSFAYMHVAHSSILWSGLRMSQTKSVDRHCLIP